MASLKQIHCAKGFPDAARTESKLEEEKPLGYKLRMPLLKLETNVQIPKEKQEPLLAELGALVASSTGKPGKYVMVTLTTAVISMSGQDGAAAFADIRSIGGLSPDVNRKLSLQICQVLKNSLQIPADRVYLNFTDVEGDDWGWNEDTFG